MNPWERIGPKIQQLEVILELQNSEHLPPGERLNLITAAAIAQRTKLEEATREVEKRKMPAVDAAAAVERLYQLALAERRKLTQAGMRRGRKS